MLCLNFHEKNMVEIVRIQKKKDLSHVGPPFEIKLEKSRELLLHREILALIQEESERILKTDHGRQFDSVAFSLADIPVPIDLLATWILKNQREVSHIYWSGKCDSCAPPTASHVDSVESASRTECHRDPHPDAQVVPLKRITISQAEKCAEQLVDIYHARYCLNRQDDFEHANAILLKKNSQGRSRTDLEMMILFECDKKIKRELQNVARRSDACEAKLIEVAEKHRQNMLSYVLSPDPYEEWYHDVGSYIKNVAATRIRHRTSRQLSNEEKEAEVLPLYPKGWFDCHVFPHLEEIHAENDGSAPEDINNMCGRNDRNIQTELQHRNLYSSHEVARAYQSNSRLRQEHKAQIHDMELKYYRQQALNKLETNKLRKTIDQKNETCSLNDSLSGHNKTIQEIERQQTVLNTQAPAETKSNLVVREKENFNHAQRKGQVKRTKRQPDEHKKPKEHENPYKRHYAGNRRR